MFDQTALRNAFCLMKRLNLKFVPRWFQSKIVIVSIGSGCGMVPNKIRAITCGCLELTKYMNRYSGIRNQESFIRGNLQYMQLTTGCIQFLLYILIWVVGKTICLEQTHIN